MPAPAPRLHASFFAPDGHVANSFAQPIHCGHAEPSCRREGQSKARGKVELHELSFHARLTLSVAHTLTIAPPSRQNSAGRIESFVIRGDAVGNVSALDGWAETLGIPPEVSGLERHNEVAKLLSALTHEIRLMDRQLKDANVPEGLRKPFVEQLGQAASISNLGNQWHNLRNNYLGPELRLSLRWFKHILPEEVLSATAEDLAELEALLAELEEKIAVDGIPASLSAFVHKQIAAIRDALRQYPIGGPVALKRATRAMVADIHLDEDEIRHAAQAGDPAAVVAAGSTLKKAWDKAVKVAGDVEKFGKAGQVLFDFGAAIAKALPSP